MSFFWQHWRDSESEWLYLSLEGSEGFFCFVVVFWKEIAGSLSLFGAMFFGRKEVSEAAFQGQNEGRYSLDLHLQASSLDSWLGPLSDSALS